MSLGNDQPRASSAYRVFWFFFVAIVLCFFVSVAIIYFVSPSAERSRNLSTAFAIWGLGVSGAGFSFTILQLLRTKSAALAAETATLKLRRDFGSLDTILELRSAIAGAQTAIDTLNEGRWESAIYQYDAISAALSKILAVSDGLSGIEQRRMKSFQADCVGACTSIENLLSEDVQEIDVPPLNAKLREMIQFLVVQENRTKESFSES